MIYFIMTYKAQAAAQIGADIPMVSRAVAEAHTMLQDPAERAVPWLANQCLIASTAWWTESLSSGVILLYALSAASSAGPANKKGRHTRRMKAAFILEKGSKSNKQYQYLNQLHEILQICFFSSNYCCLCIKKELCAVLCISRPKKLKFYNDI